MSTDLVFKHGIVVGDEVDVDVPGPVGDDDHQGQDEEEDEEVGRLRVAAVQQAEHGDQEDDAESDVQVPGSFICSTTLDNKRLSVAIFQCNIAMGGPTLVVLTKFPLEIALLQPALLKILFLRKMMSGTAGC